MLRFLSILSILSGIVFFISTFPAMLVVGIMAATGQIITFSSIFYVLTQVIIWSIAFVVIGFLLIALGIYMHRVNKNRQVIK